MLEVIDLTDGSGTLKAIAEIPPGAVFQGTIRGQDGTYIKSMGSKGRVFDFTAGVVVSSKYETVENYREVDAELAVTSTVSI